MITFQILRPVLACLAVAMACAPVSGLRGAVEAWSWHGQGNIVRIDAAGGARIAEWRVGGRQLVDPAGADGPLSLVAGDGRAFRFEAENTRVVAPNRFRIEGRLRDGATAFPVAMSYEVLQGGERLAVTVEPGETSSALAVREFTWSLPLALQPRKRAYLLGDHGLVWDTRYFYQTFLNPGDSWKIMREPDRNEWRHFGLDQLGAGAVRLWKSESARTAPLVMQQGVYAAPLALLYDERGGVLLTYPDMAARAPSALRVDAGGGGVLAVQFHPAHAAPAPAKDALAGARAFTLDARSSEAAVLALQKECEAKYADAFTPRPDPARILDEPDWIVKPPVAAGAPIQVSGGYPFARGELAAVENIHVVVGGEAVPVQARALAYWPDRSIKWALLTFEADAGRAVADCAAPRVSLRDGRFLPVAVSIGKPVAPPAGGVEVTQTAAGGVAIKTGALTVDLRTGEKWLAGLSLDGKSLLDPAADGARIYSDYRYDPRSVFPFDRAPEGGEDDRGVLVVKSLAVEESGPLRAIVRLEGLTTNREPLRVVLRLEFRAGRPEIRVAHTAVFRITDARRAFLTGMGLELPLAGGLFKEVAVDGETFDAGKSGVAVSRIQESSGSARIESGRTRSEAKAVGAEIRVSGEAGAVSAVLRNARQLSSNALVADPKSGKLRIEFWPEATAPMDMRRYSEHLQFGQLESAATETPGTWVNDVYYRQESVYGLSRTHEVLLDFSRPAEARNTDALAADFESGPLLYAGWERYVSTKVVLPSSAEAESPRAWDSWTRLARFFLFHRELHDWYGFWNFGDFRHRMGGFGGIVSPEILKKMPSEGQLANRIWDNIPSGDWGYDNGAYGWTNTEGLPGLFLASEYLRHGNRAVFFASEAMTRYARDVIIRQEGRWLGRGTRHGVQPWSDGNHEERQTAATEYRHHYFLTGEGRTRDVIENLYRNVYLKGEVNRHASHSGRTIGLLFHWELTGDETEGARLQNYMRQFASPEGVWLSPSVRFPEASRGGEPKILNTGNQFFHTFGGMHAMIEYHELTRDPVVGAALLKMAEAIIRQPIIENGRLGQGEYSWAPVAFAALHAEDPAPYRAFLARYIKADGWRSAYQPVTVNPAHWTGDSALMTKTVALSLFWANWAPYVALAGGEEIWTPEIEKEFARYEANGRDIPRRRASWQSQFDGIPEIDAYLGPQQPWRAGKSNPSE